MNNLKCFYLNIYQLDKQFVYQQPKSGAEAPKPERLASYVKPRPDVAPGGKPQPAGPPSPATEKAEKAAAETAAKGKSVIKKRQTSDQLALIPEFGEFDVGKLDKRSIDGMSKQQQKDTFRKSEGGGTYVINFGGRGTVAERMIGLRHLFDEKTPFLVVQDKMGAILSFAEYRNGNFYDAKTDRRVRIYNGYKIFVPQTPEDLARFQQMAKKERLAYQNKLRERAEQNAVAAAGTPGEMAEAPAQAVEVQAPLRERFRAYISTSMVGSSLDETQTTILANALLRSNRYSSKSTKKDWKKDRAKFLNVYRYYLQNNKKLDEEQLATAFKLELQYRDKDKMIAELSQKDLKHKFFEYWEDLSESQRAQITSASDTYLADVLFALNSKFDIGKKKDKLLFYKVCSFYRQNPNLPSDRFAALVKSGFVPPAGETRSKDTAMAKAPTAPPTPSPEDFVGPPEPPPAQQVVAKALAPAAPAPAPAPRAPEESARGEAVAKAPAKPEAIRRNDLDLHFQKAYSEINVSDRRALVDVIFKYNKNFDINRTVYQNVLRITMDQFLNVKRLGRARNIKATLLAILRKEDLPTQEKHKAELRKLAEEYASSQGLKENDMKVVLDAIFEREKGWFDSTHENNKRLIVLCAKVYRENNKIIGNEMYDTAERYGRILDYMSTLGIKGEASRYAFLDILIERDRTFDVKNDVNKKLMDTFVAEYKQKFNFTDNPQKEIRQWKETRVAIDKVLEVERLAGQERPEDEDPTMVAQADTK